MRGLNLREWAMAVVLCGTATELVRLLYVHRTLLRAEFLPLDGVALVAWLAAATWGCVRVLRWWFRRAA